MVQQNHFFALKDVIDRRPLTVTSKTALTEVIRLMQEWGNSCSLAAQTDSATDSINLSNSSCVLVVENSQLRGIFTERDLVKLIATEADTQNVTVGDMMTQDVVSLTLDDSQDMFAALDMLRSHGIRHLPVVDKDCNLLGLITAKNLREKLQPVNMMKWRKVEEIMETEVVYAAPDDSIRHLAKLMTTHKSSYVAIAESKLDPAGNRSFLHPIGIVTERDIVHQNLNLDLEQPARNIMSAPLFLTDPEASLWSVKQQMQQHHVRRLLVGSDREELLGIITQSSLLKIFDPTEMYEVIEALQQQICQLETDKELLLETRQAELEQEVQERTAILKSTKQQLQRKVRQQQAVAELGQFALTEKNLASILDRTVNLVATTLEVEYCKVLELLPGGEDLLLKAGVGWHDRLVGVATVKVDRSSQAGYTLLSTEPVIVDNLLTETRFSGPNLLLDHQVISGVSITIGGNDKPFGILGIHTTQRRNFSQDDVNFIQAIANIIAQANERKQAELKLEQSEQKFRAIFDQSFQFIGLLKPNGDLIEANQTALDFVGLTIADVRGKPFWETPWWSISVEIQATIKQAIKQAAQGEFVRLEVEHPGTENRVITVDFSLTPIKDETGKVVMLIPEGRDISNLKQAEVSLRESQERYALAVAGSSSGLWDWNVLTNEVFYAPRWKEILGCTDAELPNTVEAWSSRLHPEDGDRVLIALQDHLTNRVPYNIEYRLQKKDRQYCWVQARGQAIWDEQGQAVRMAGSIADISEQQAALCDRQRREEILKDIASGVSVEVGENFFQSLVEYLSKTLQIDYAFISKLIQSKRDSVNTLAVYGKGETLDNFAYDLANAPCGEVMGKGLCVYPQAVQQLFPDIPPLEAMAAESYAGMPIFDAAGKVIGLIAVVDSKPMNDIALIEEVLKIFATRATAELERQQVEADLQQSNQILQAISSIQTQFLTDTEPASLFDGMLDCLLELTESEYGFIGEIFLAEAGNPVMEDSYMKFRGRPYLKTHAITNIAWNDETRAFYAENAPKGMEFHNLQTLFGAVIVTGEPVIANSPSNDPRRGGLPDGHPPLNAFLGVPFYKNDRMTGMVGIANRAGGYDEDTIHYLRPFLDTCSRIIEAYKTERQKQQTSAKLREQAALLDLTHDTILVCNLDNIITFWNQGAVEMYGWTAEEALGQNSHQLMTAQFAQPLAEIETELFRAGHWEGEVTHRRKDGSALIVMGRWSLLRDATGNPEQILEINHDITKRKQAEQKIIQQAALLDVATDAIMVRSLDDKILFWNRGAEKIYGWTKAEALNKIAYELLYRESPTQLSKTQQEVIDRGEWQGELKQVTKAGQDIIVQSRWTLVKDDAGNPHAYLVVKTDVTEQKQLEVQFLRTQRLESLGTLAGGIAHDLNNILAPILGFARLLPLKLPDVDEQTKGFFKIMENNAQRGSALVKQILTFSRGLEGDRGVVQVRHLIAEIGQIINETFPKTIELEINAPKNLWTVNADVNQLHQVLMNLAVNARDAMPDGGKLTIKAENYTVDANYAKLHLDATEGAYLLITVTDTGVGIPPEVIDRIFEPFFTTKEVGRGTGLGLSTVIGIIKSHDGFVEVVSDRQTNSKGTRFQVFLPASSTAELALEESEAIPQGNGELILVVDDEAAILEVTKATLETYNYKVLTASDGIEAIAMYAQNQQEIDLVITDMMMPNMDGKTAILTLKKINPSVKVIAVSGLINSQEIADYMNDDFTAFLSKPYSNDDLLIKIDKMVSS